jgi:hypothetical protein
MFKVGEEVNTRYGPGVVVCVGSVKPHVYVRVDSRSAIYMFNESDVSTTSKYKKKRVTVSGEDHATSITVSLVNSHTVGIRGSEMKNNREVEQTPLSIFVRSRLAELGMKQAEFCRLNSFDQGLLSRIQSSMITNLSLESVLRLAIGLAVSPKQILNLIGRTDLHFLVVRAYTDDVSDVARNGTSELPSQVVELSYLAMRVHQMGFNLAPALNALASLITKPEEMTNYLASEAQSSST